MEKRGYERFKLTGNVNVKNQQEGESRLTAYLDNISFGGFAMYAPEKIPVDTAVDFDLMTEALGQPLAGRGRVRYAAASGYGNTVFNMGVEFVDIDRDAITYLLKRIQARIAEQARNKAGARPLDFMPY